MAFRCIPGKAARRALHEATELWPNRRKTSDGICSSPQHRLQNPTSDHDTGNAFDLSHDPDNGCDAHGMADEFVSRVNAGNPPAGAGRVKYIISQGRIWNPRVSPEWREYGGSNPHNLHAHWSLWLAGRDDETDWWSPLLIVPLADIGEWWMALAKNDLDGMRAYVRDAMWRYWGRGPNSVEELNMIAQHGLTHGLDAALILIVDDRKNKVRK